MTDLNISETVRKAINDAVEVIISEEADEAGKRVSIRVRAKTAEISTRILNRFQMQQRGSELIIRVDLENFPK